MPRFMATRRMCTCVIALWRGARGKLLHAIFFCVRRIPVEEAILRELFGEQYLAYSEKVGRLGPQSLDCCGFMEVIYRAVVPAAAPALREHEE